MVAQDTGGAIKGVVRGDVFWGAGERAEAIAGRMKSPGRYAVLLPRALVRPAERRPRRQFRRPDHRLRSRSRSRATPSVRLISTSPPHAQPHPRTAPRRAVRHLPGRPVPAGGRLRRGRAARGRRLPGRGAARPDLLRPAGLQSGRPRRHRRIARRTIAALAGYDYVVVPSGSCAGMLKKHYPELFAAGSADAERARELAGRTYELISFLVDVMGVTSGRGRTAGARHLPRFLLEPARARRQAAAAPAARERARPGARRAARRRGLLRLRRHLLRQVPGDLDQDGRRQGGATIEATGAELVLAADLGCLMNIAGRL